MGTNFEVEIFRGLKEFERQRQHERLKEYEEKNSVEATTQQAKKDEISELIGAMTIIKNFYERHNG